MSGYKLAIYSYHRPQPRMCITYSR